MGAGASSWRESSDEDGRCDREIQKSLAAYTRMGRKRGERRSSTRQNPNTSEGVKGAGPQSVGIGQARKRSKGPRLSEINAAMWGVENS